MIADRDTARIGADFLDDASGFVAEHDRHRIAQRPRNDFEIGVAQACGLDADENVVAPHVIRNNGFEGQRRLRRMQYRRAI